MDEFRNTESADRLHAGVDGLGFGGRESGDDQPTIADDGVAGLGFGGRPQPDEFDADKFVVSPEQETDDDETTDPDVDDPEDETD
jgi:hypothetical protein